MPHQMHVDLSSERTMVLTRLFDAPRDLVWQCWTDPGHLAAWWGPAGMTNRVDQDLRPGGHQNITMIDANGTEYPIRSLILEVVAGEKLVGTIAVDDHPGDFHDLFAAYAGGDSDGKLRIVMEVLLEDAPDGKTLLTVRQTFLSGAERDANMKMGAEQGWAQSFDKLDTLVARLLAA